MNILGPAGLGGATLVVAALGAVARLRGGPRLFTLDAEQVVPAIWSGFLLLLAAAAALAVARADRADARWRWWPLAVLFCFMAGDETMGLHEWVERRTQVDWQLLYLPLMAAGGAAALGALQRLRTFPTLVAGLVASCGAWVLAQALEALQWDGGRQVRGYGEMMVSEEVLEMAGSLGFALTLLTAARWLRDREAARDRVSSPRQRFVPRRPAELSSPRRR
jgi:hypothetical protein